MPTETTTPRQRFEALDEQTQARWLVPAEAEFCEHGFEKASLNRIIARAGESKGRTYHYFADKGALFCATLERRVRQCDFLDQVSEAASAPNATGYWLELGALCARLTKMLQGDDRLASLLRTLHRESAAQQSFAEPLAAIRGAIDDLLVAGQSIGAVRDDLPITLLTEVALNLIATVDRWFALNGSTLSEDAEAALSQRAFLLLMAPLLPSQFTEGISL
ncbi:TetR/AcrR family transcriptional regulator [Sinirhodobacter ferrireducens]|uniref:TetR/AcrR family transcriptional regulator n=1 Tax=Paenirhodobacter ferrireducens TaxID=1215032 RepID=A0A443L478_9RHOB|nr:TetR/AcrR family transcriptional regulator [Sinirhodobacter ferrireducens]RWR44012.1 TetR/AcrR family transcriptional regulator [Sinirhodobacter ferrireducens]